MLLYTGIGGISTVFTIVSRVLNPGIGTIPDTGIGIGASHHLQHTIQQSVQFISVHMQFSMTDFRS